MASSVLGAPQRDRVLLQLAPVLLLSAYIVSQFSSLWTNFQALGKRIWRSCNLSFWTMHRPISFENDHWCRFFILEAGSPAPFLFGHVVSLFARQSANSFPVVPLWPLTHLRLTVVCLERVCSSLTASLTALLLTFLQFMAAIAACESDRISTVRFSYFVFPATALTASAMARTSAWNTVACSVSREWPFCNNRETGKKITLTGK